MALYLILQEFHQYMDLSLKQVSTVKLAIYQLATAPATSALEMAG